MIFVDASALPAVITGEADAVALARRKPNQATLLCKGTGFAKTDLA